MSNANKDDKLVSIRAEFGMWGIGVYWTLIEFVAEQVKEKSEQAEATLIVSELLGFFGCKRNKLETFLERSQNVGLFTYTVSDNVLKINIPKMLDYADNYIKYEGKSLKTLQRKNKMSSKQEENRIEENRKKSTKIDASFTIPEYLNNPDFIRTFHEFIAHRQEIKRPLTQRAGDKLLKKLCEYSCDTAIKMLDQSIENSWQGVFPLKGNGNGTDQSGNGQGFRRSKAGGATTADDLRRGTAVARKLLERDAKGNA